MRWRSKLGVSLAAICALGACAKSRQTVSGPRGHGGTGGSLTGSGGSTAGDDGGATDTGGTSGNGAANAVGGNSSNAGSATNGGTSSAGIGASSGTKGDPGPPSRDDGTPTATVPECLHEQASPEELDPPTDVRVGSTWLRSSERDCEWTVGDPMALPLEPDDPGTLLFQFDLNGDHVDDLIFGDWARGPTTASGQSLVLLTSRLEDGELTYERSPCGTPWDITHRSFFARDLDRDGAPDFVIGRINGISAMLNRPGERPEVLHYDWPAGQAVDAYASILDVAVGDYDADGRDDIAVGFDRSTGKDLFTMETGVLLFRDRSAEGTYGVPEHLVQLTVDFSTAMQPHSQPAGILATVETGSDTVALFSLNITMYDGTGFKYEAGKAETFLAPSIQLDGPIFAQGSRFGGAPTLMVATRDDLVVLEPTAPYPAVSNVHFAYSHANDHELGGGTRIRSVFVVDLDGDGDEDLIERGRGNFDDSGQLWVHNRTSESAFDDAVLVQNEHASSQFVESPFVRAGVMPARIFVQDGSPDTAALYPIACYGR